MIRFGRSAYLGFGAIGCLVILLVPALVAIGLLADTEADPKPVNTSRVIAPHDLKSPWPFKVPAVDIVCGDGSAIFLEADNVAIGITRYSRRDPSLYFGRGQVIEPDGLYIKNVSAESIREVSAIASERCQPEFNKSLESANSPRV